jgi:hypothetical protein
MLRHYKPLLKTAEKYLAAGLEDQAHDLLRVERDLQMSLSSQPGEAIEPF